MTDFVLRKISSFLPDNLAYCQDHYAWAQRNKASFFTLESAGKRYSIAINTDARTICSTEGRSIISYDSPLSISQGIEIVQFLEDEYVLSTCAEFKKYHRSIISALSQRNINPIHCDCGAVKTYGRDALKQKFLHSHWCKFRK